MSPVGGVGINLAIQDAVAAANLLAAKLRDGRVDADDLDAVRQRRLWPTKATQTMQVAIQNNVLVPVLGSANAELRRAAADPRRHRRADACSACSRACSAWACARSTCARRWPDAARVGRLACGLLCRPHMRTDTVKLHVGSDITVRAASACPIVAMLRPASGLAQWLSSETYAFDPWVPTTEYVDVYGNLCQRMVVPQGEMRLRVEATVETERELAVAPGAPYVPVDSLPDSALLYLLPSRYCPSDKLQSKAWQVVGDASPGYGQVEAIRAWINAISPYRYGSSDASTDAAATLDAEAPASAATSPMSASP